MNAYNVAIAGAGPAGSVVAALLARTGMRTALIEPAGQCTHKIGECLPDAGAQLLRRLQLPAPADCGQHDRITGVHSLWGTEEHLYDAFNDPGNGGWRLDRARFDNDLRSAALESGAVLLRDFVTGVVPDDSGWKLRTRAGADIKTELVIDATGRRAGIARRLGVRQHTDTPVVAIWAVGTTRVDKPYTRTLIETVAYGWWYGAMLPSGNPIVALHCEPAVAKKLVRNPDQWFTHLANTRLLCRFLSASHFRATKLNRADARGLVLDTSCGNGWFACGDAAISFNPLASQGLFNSVATAAMVARSVLADDLAAAQASYRSHINAVRASYCAHLQELERRRVGSSKCHFDLLRTAAKPGTLCDR